eukprot:9554831-Karenia_brevis.AAC.1
MAPVFLFLILLAGWSSSTCAAVSSLALKSLIALNALDKTLPGRSASRLLALSNQTTFSAV